MPSSVASESDLAASIEADKSASQYSSQPGSLFVGDLSIFCTEADMQRAFEPFGEIVEVKVMRCDETHKNLCYGFVKYASIENAQTAMDSLKSALLCGRPMRISWASHKARGHDQSSEIQFMSTSSVHISYSANQIEVLITEEILREVFGKYGPIHDITIKKFEVDQKAQVQRGYGFVHFPASEEGVNAALKCVDALKDKIVDNIHYKCDVSHKLLRQLRTHNPSHTENIGHSSHGRHHNHNHQGNNYQQQPYHSYKGTSTLARDHSQFHSQSSELSDLTAPSIDLSPMSLESMGSGAQMYPMHPYFTHLPAPPTLTHPQGPPPGPMIYSMPGHLAQPPLFHPNHQSSTPSFPHPESLYIDVYQQQQMMFQPMPGNTIPPPGGYPYFPSASTTPTSHYVRSINPSGKAPYSSSTTTAMMSDMKMSISSSSSNPATPMASPAKQQPATTATQSQQHPPPVSTVPGMQHQGSGNIVDVKSTGPAIAVENTRSPTQDTTRPGEVLPQINSQTTPMNSKPIVQLHHQVNQNNHQLQNQHPLPQSHSPQYSSNGSSKSPSQMPLSPPLFPQPVPNSAVHHVPSPQGNHNNHTPHNTIYSSSGQIVPVSTTGPVQAGFAPSPVPTMPVPSNVNHPSPKLASMAYTMSAPMDAVIHMNHQPLPPQHQHQHQHQQQLLSSFVSVPPTHHLSVHPTSLPTSNELVYYPVLPSVAGPGSAPMMLSGQFVYHQQHPATSPSLQVHPAQGPQQPLSPSQQPMLPPPTLPHPVAGAPNGVMLTVHSNGNNAGAAIPPPHMPGFVQMVLPPGYAPHPPPSLTYAPPPHMQQQHQTQVQQQLPPPHQYQHHHQQSPHHQQHQQLRQQSIANQSNGHHSHLR
jgi:RNA recognition motif-containing protein